MNTKYITCENYCESIELRCVNSYEETSDSCVEESRHSCFSIVDGSLNKPSTDVICECTSDDDYEGYDGRPFIVEGSIRSPVSLRCNADICPDATAWTLGMEPSFLNNTTISMKIGLEWLTQAEAEHASIASFSRHTLQLMSIGAPSELITRSQQASIDEIEHAKLCYGFASEFMRTNIYPGPLDTAGSLGNMDMEEIIESVVRDGCIQETMSAIEGHFRAHYATEEVIKISLTKLAADEAKHSQLAWDTIKWVIEQHPKYENFVNQIFTKEFRKQEKLAAQNTGQSMSSLCSDLSLEEMSTRYGIISNDDKERVRHAGLKKIIKFTYLAGLDYYSSISDQILKLNYAEIYLLRN